MQCMAVQGGDGQPDCLLLAQLPFAEDLRAALFTAFTAKAELLPTQQQLDSATALVKGLSLAGARPPAAL